MSNDAEEGFLDRAASSFYIIVTVASTPPFTVITVWQDERKLVAKEVNQNVYSLDTYFWAKTLTVFPVEAFFSLLVCADPPRPAGSCSSLPEGALLVRAQNDCTERSR